jgi:hypothetical protein
MPMTVFGQSTSASQVETLRFGYSFSNFVWWTDADLRTELKRKIPNLPDEIAAASPIEGRIRTALMELLKTKGIRADVQSIDPSPDAFTKQRAPGSGPPTIVYSVSAPPSILIEKLVLENPAADAGVILQSVAKDMELRPYNSSTFWVQKDRVQRPLRENGYLTAKISFASGEPRKDGDRYLVPLIATIDNGKQFRVGKISADGGPLLHGRDLSQYFKLHEGDIASPTAFGMLPSMVRSTYTHAGFMDVEVHIDPILDVERGQALYHLEVEPGEQYHLCSVAVQGLDKANEQTARGLLSIKPQDVYDETAVMTLFRKVSETAEFKGMNFHSGTKKDSQTHSIDLTLFFARPDAKPSSVTAY